MATQTLTNAQVFLGANDLTGFTGQLDTGCDFTLRTVQSGVNIAHWENAGGSAWTRAPRIITFDTGGAAVGDQSPIVAHERLRLTVTQSEGVAGSKTCKLYVWTVS